MKQTSGVDKFAKGIRIVTVPPLILTLFNKLLHIRASGHAASAVSPCVFSLMYAGVAAGCAFGLVFLLSAWASVHLRRHKVTDILAGVGVFALALSGAWLISTIYA